MPAFDVTEVDALQTRWIELHLHVLSMKITKRKGNKVHHCPNPEPILNILCAMFLRDTLTGNMSNILQFHNS